MKRRRLVAHLRQHGCFLLREGGRHSWWSSADNAHRSSIPRHAEIIDLLAKKICSDLGVPPVE